MESLRFKKKKKIIKFLIRSILCNYFSRNFFEENQNGKKNYNIDLSVITLLIRKSRYSF